MRLRPSSPSTWSAVVEMVDRARKGLDGPADECAVADAHAPVAPRGAVEREAGPGGRGIVWGEIFDIVDTRGGVVQRRSFTFHCRSVRWYRRAERASPRPSLPGRSRRRHR